MAFDSSDLQQQPGDLLSEDRFRSVELSTTFKQLTCSRCHLTSIYKYRVKQIRRKAEIEVPEGEEVREDHRQIWNSIPRFAEIPETIHCKRCREVLGVYTECIF